MYREHNGLGAESESSFPISFERRDELDAEIEREAHERNLRAAERRCEDYRLWALQDAAARRPAPVDVLPIQPSTVKPATEPPRQRTIAEALAEVTEPELAAELEELFRKPI